MTCILTYKPQNQDPDTTSIFLATDARVSGGMGTSTINRPKLMIRDDIMIGYSGSVQDANSLAFDLPSFQREENNDLLRGDPDLGNEGFIHKFATQMISTVVLENPMRKTPRPYNDDEEEDGHYNGKLINLNIMLAYRGLVCNADSTMTVLMLSTKFGATGSGIYHAEGAYGILDKIGLRKNRTVLDELEKDVPFLLRTVLDSVSDGTFTVGPPYAVVEQRYTKSTGITNYFVHNTWAPLNWSRSNLASDRSSITYLEDTFAQYSFPLGEPLVTKSKTKGKKARLLDVAEDESTVPVAANTPETKKNTKGRRKPKTFDSTDSGT